MTVSFFVFLFTHPSLGPSSTAVLTPRRIKAVFRWGLITAWWVVVTQWCFGPALIDRGFLLTGGACEIIAQSDSAEEAGMSEGRAIATGLACKAVGGQWKGGHDISGHVFLLVLGSAFLVQEVIHVVMRTSEQQEERTIVMGDGAVKSAKVENGSRDEGKIDVNGKWDLGIKIVVGVAALSWWMLLMTAAFFHTWFEKVGQLCCALLILGFTDNHIAHRFRGGVHGYLFCVLPSPGCPSVAGDYWHAWDIGDRGNGDSCVQALAYGNMAHTGIVKNMSLW